MYNPLWATPSCLVVLFWKDLHFSFRATYVKWRSREYWTFLLPSALISVWLVWLPAVSIIYCMPASLQIPLFAIVLCFWSIILSMVSKAAETDVDAGPAAGVKVDGVEEEVDGEGARGASAGGEEGEGEEEEDEDAELDEDDEEVELADVDDSTASVSR